MCKQITILWTKSFYDSQKMRTKIYCRVHKLSPEVAYRCVWKMCPARKSLNKCKELFLWLRGSSSIHNYPSNTKTFLRKICDLAMAFAVFFWVSIVWLYDANKHGNRRGVRNNTSHPNIRTRNGADVRTLRNRSSVVTRHCFRLGSTSGFAPSALLFGQKFELSSWIRFRMIDYPYLPRSVTAPFGSCSGKIKHFSILPGNRAEV